MKEFENRPEFTPKDKNEQTFSSATAVLEDWKPTTMLCPKCGGKHTAFNKMCVLTTYPEQYQYKCCNCGHRWTDFKAQPLGPMQGWPNLEYEDVTPIGQMGWICPKCGRVYAPHMDWCTNCGGTYSPNIVYCGPNNGTKDILDTITISNSVNSPQTNATIAGMAKNALHEELQNSIKNSTK